MNKEYYYNSKKESEKQRGGYNQYKIDHFVKCLKQIKGGSKILDIGCNDGTLAEEYKKFGRVYGVDINPVAVKSALEKGIDTKCANVFELRDVYPDNHFDVVIAGDIIEHVLDTDLFLEIIYQVLKPGGLLLLSTPNLASLGRRIMLLFGKNSFCEFSTKIPPVKGSKNVGHIRYYTCQNLYNQLKINNFRDISVRTDVLHIPFVGESKFLAKLFRNFGRYILVSCSK